MIEGNTSYTEYCFITAKEVPPTEDERKKQLYGKIDVLMEQKSYFALSDIEDIIDILSAQEGVHSPTGEFSTLISEVLEIPKQRWQSMGILLRAIRAKNPDAAAMAAMLAK